MSFGTQFEDGKENSYLTYFIIPGSSVHVPMLEPFCSTVGYDNRPCNVSVLYFCPECGEQWGARLDISLDGGPSALFHAQDRYCAKHGNGSLLDQREFDAYGLEFIPRAVLVHELMLILSRREIDNGNKP